ncbi:hypothetical protein CEE39_06020 [bacterium (candidate division B38) B3_B38]|nr:MAG: hypothetical protein CEE39_06020 [bacterium (candidate division B38) B3_B38]
MEGDSPFAFPSQYLLSYLLSIPLRVAISAGIENVYYQTAQKIYNLYCQTTLTTPESYLIMRQYFFIGKFS